MVAEREQRRDIPIRAQPDVAASAAVTAVRTAPWHVRLASERDTAGATVAALHVALREVDEAGHSHRIRTVRRGAAGSPYDRAMRPPRVALLSATVAIVGLSACSASHPASPHTASTSVASDSSTGSVSTIPVASDVQIVSLRGPTAAVVCNAPTQVELHWVTRHAKTVTLQINGGPVFASYPNGMRDELVPLTCDGNPQTYALTARAPGGTVVTKSLTIAERQLNAS